MVSVFNCCGEKFSKTFLMPMEENGCARGGNDLRVLLSRTPDLMYQAGGHTHTGS
jgi:hypothetical protein